jgi:diguanylate cyclase (GGDEF)-like protein/PAS domain S-box-containing protein
MSPSHDDPGVIVDPRILEQLHSVLASDPRAKAVVFGDDALVVEAPADLPLEDHAILQVRWPLDLVVSKDWSRLVEAWDTAKANGVSAVSLGLASGFDGVIHTFDLRPEYGVWVSVVVENAKSVLDQSSALEEWVATPRVCRFIVNSTAIITSIDVATQQLLGWTSDQLVGHWVPEFIYSDDRDTSIGTWLHLLSSPENVVRSRYRLQRADESWIWVEAFYHAAVNDGRVTSVEVEIIDISAEMAAFDALDARERLLNRLTESLPDGVLQINEVGAVIYTNDLLWRIFSVDAPQHIDDVFVNVVEPDRVLLKNALKEAMSDKSNADIVVVANSPGDVERICRIVIRPLLNTGEAVVGALLCVSDVTEATNLHRKLEKIASTDELTRCFNRRSIMSHLNAAITDWLAEDQIAVMFIDLNQFKLVNDTWGHATGDSILAAAGERLRRTVRETDLVGRLGGDEFLVVSSGQFSSDSAFEQAERVSRVMSQPVTIPDGTQVMTSASIGVAWSSDHTIRSETLLHAADTAMYQSKVSANGPVMHVFS